MSQKESKYLRIGEIVKDQFGNFQIKLRQDVDLYVKGKKLGFKENKNNPKNLDKYIPAFKVSDNIEFMQKKVEEGTMDKELVAKMTKDYETRGTKYLLQISKEKLS